MPVACAVRNEFSDTLSDRTVPRNRLTLLRQERQPFPPPNDSPVLDAQSKGGAHVAGRAMHGVQYAPAIFRRRCRGVEVPVQVRLFERLQLGANDIKPG